MALAGQGTAVWQLQIALRPFQGLDRRLFIDAQNDRLDGRVHIETDNVGGFRRKVWIVALAPGLAGHQVDFVVPQAAPDILNIDIGQRLGQQRPCPPCEPCRRRLVQKFQYPLVCRRRVDRLLARTRLILQPVEPVVGIAMPPKAHNPGLNTHLFGNRPRALAFRRQQNNLSTLQITLHGARRPATSLQLLAIAAPKSHYSGFGNHPDLESRLTLHEKRVLGARPDSYGIELFDE